MGAHILHTLPATIHYYGLWRDITTMAHHGRQRAPVVGSAEGHGQPEPADIGRVGLASHSAVIRQPARCGARANRSRRRALVGIMVCQPARNIHRPQTTLAWAIECGVTLSKERHPYGAGRHH
jgi:hypothetical protein